MPEDPSKSNAQLIVLNVARRTKRARSSRCNALLVFLSLTKLSFPAAALNVRVSSLALTELGSNLIGALAVDSEGTIFLSTDSAIYFITPAGVLELHAGSRTRTGFRDSEGARVR